ncbi:recombinase family protein [Pseudonocardia sp. N23]|uniref:recombinase family protein n=1 Tax=Pseudonocardia sp. N23 TaxID=1987376 RepID=UPI001559420C|nr:recombinase family protein [Pseudonocardia sp. N23]
MPKQEQGVRAVIYARASQDRDGTARSVDQQRVECREFADQRGFQVVAELADNDMSAYAGKPRPAYIELLRMIREGETDAVIVWEQSRLTRRPYELEQYIEVCEPRGVATHMVTSGFLDLTTDQGRLVARMMGAQNRYEVDQLRGRVKRGLRSRSAKGLPGGGRRPFGFLADKVTHDPIEAAAIRSATESVVLGESVHGIAREWRAQGLVTTTGKPWTTTQLRALLRRPRNAGLMQHQGRVAGRASWEPIVPAELWTACVAVLDDPQRRTSPGTQPAYLGTFIYRCGAIVDEQECGLLMRSWRSGKPAVKVYRCTATDRKRDGVTTRHVTIPIAPTDEYVGEVILAQLHELGHGLPLEVEDTAPPTPVTTIQELEARQSKLAMQFATGVLPEDAYTAAMTLIIAQREQLAQSFAAPIRIARDEVFDLARERSRWEDLSLDRRRALVSDIATVTILPAGSGNRLAVADRVRVQLHLEEWDEAISRDREITEAARVAWEQENPRLPGETLIEWMNRGPQ